MHTTISEHSELDERARRRVALDAPSDDAVASELTAITAPGAAMVAAAERFARVFASSAFDHDRSATFATEHLDKLRADRFLVSPIPADLGGNGVDSVHDVLVSCSRLARGDAATAIGVNMHFAVLLNIVRGWQVGMARGAEDQASVLAGLLRHVADEDVLFASAVSESSPQGFTRPRTAAVRTEDGWVIDGHKVFATMAPAATIVNTAVTYRAADGSERYGFAFVLTSAPGVELHDDWDAIGMRASASGSMSLHAVCVDAGAVRDGFATGVYSSALFDRFLSSERSTPRRTCRRASRSASPSRRSTTPPPPTPRCTASIALIPITFEPVLSGGDAWRKRIGLIRANASRMSHDELDNGTELDAGDPAELGGQYAELRRRFPTHCGDRRLLWHRRPSRQCHRDRLRGAVVVRRD